MRAVNRYRYTEAKIRGLKEGKSASSAVMVEGEKCKRDFILRDNAASKLGKGLGAYTKVMASGAVH